MLARCLQPAERACLVHDPSCDLTLGPSLNASLESLCEDLRAQGRRVERLPVYRVASFEADSHGLRLVVGHTDYGVALGQWLQPQLWDQRLPTLAVCALTMCGDHAVVEERSERVAVSGGLIHVKPSGNLQPPEQPLDGLYREAFEELGLESTDLHGCGLLGLTVCHEVLWDLVYRVESRRPLEQVLQSRGADAWEHDRLLAVDCRPEELANWLHDNYRRCSPPGHAALVLEGWRRHGDRWFDSVWKNLD